MSPDAFGSHPLRPRDLATLLLASGDLLPRQRARDQQADVAGGELKQRVLARIAELDPEPSDLLAALDRVIQEFGEPTGPTRAIATGVREEFESLSGQPPLLEWLLERGAERSAR